MRVIELVSLPERVNVSIFLSDIITTEKKNSMTAYKTKLTMTLSIDGTLNQGKRNFDINVTSGSKRPTAVDSTSPSTDSSK